MSDLTPDQRALCRAVDLIASIPEAKIARYRHPNNTSTGIGVFYTYVLDLIDAIEEANPGWIARTRAGSE